MKKVLLLFACTCIFSLAFNQTEYDDEVPAENQEQFVGYNKKNKKDKDLSRILIGGSANFSFSNNTFFLAFSPLVGYQVVKDRLELGGGAMYQYVKYSDRRYGYDVNTIGPNAYAKLYVWNQLFVQGRCVYLKNYGKTISGLKFEGNFWNVFAGAGYSVDFSEKAKMNIGLEINLLEYDPRYSNAKRVISPFFNFQYRL